MPLTGIVLARLRQDGFDRLRAGVHRAAAVEKSDQHGQFFSGDEGQEFAAQRGVLEEDAAHDRVDHLGVHVLHAAPGHAVVAGFHHDGQAVGLGLFHDQVGQLHHGLFLDLRAAHHPLGQPRVLGQADHVGVLVGHDADPELADHGAEMVAAGRLRTVIGPTIISSFRCSALGNSVMARLLDVAALEHLVEVHLGDAARRVVGVVVARRCR